MPHRPSPRPVFRAALCRVLLWACKAPPVIAAMAVLLVIGERTKGAAEDLAGGAGPEISVSIVVALDGGQPVVDPAWVDGQIAEANRLYASIPLRFRRVSLASASWLAAHVDTREDRDRASGRLVHGAINLRVAASLMDVDEPGRVRRGVHWHLRADRRRHCIILSSIAAPQVLAHELGHFFGNGHSEVTDNLMSYSRANGPLFLDAAQVAQVRRTLKSYLHSRELAQPVEPR